MHESGRDDQPGQRIDRVQREVHVARYRRVFGVGLYRVDDLGRHVAPREDFLGNVSVHREVLDGAVVVEVVQETGERPLVLVAAQSFRKLAHARLGGVHVLAQILRLYVFLDKLERFVSGHRHTPMRVAR